MNIIDDVIIKRKVYILTVAKISAIFSGLWIYSTAWKLLEGHLFYRRLVGEYNDSDFMPIESIKAINSQIDAFGIIVLCVGIGFLFASIGLIKLKNWARVLFIGLSWLLNALSLGVIVYYIVNHEGIISILLDYKSAGQANIITALDNWGIYVMSLKFAFILIVQVLIMRTLLRISLRFRKSEYKAFFS